MLGRVFYLGYVCSEGTVVAMVGIDDRDGSFLGLEMGRGWET